MTRIAFDIEDGQVIYSVDGRVKSIEPLDHLHLTRFESMTEFQQKDSEGSFKNLGRLPNGQGFVMIYFGMKCRPDDFNALQTIYLPETIEVPEDPREREVMLTNYMMRNAKSSSAEESTTEQREEAKRD
jgi:hypothetical protein